MKICDCCYGTSFEVTKDGCRCLECGEEYDSYEAISNAPELTVEMVKRAYEQGAVELICNNNNEIMCQIGDWDPFFFDGLEGEGFESVQDYIDSYGGDMDEICAEILLGLDGMKERDDIEEWLTYAFIIEEFEK